MTTKQDAALIRKNARTGLIVLAVVAFMIGLSFASVPLYRVFCQVTGFGGTTQTAKSFPATQLPRQVEIRFNADVGRNMPWKFQPEQRSITVHLGQKGLIAYHAHNLVSYPVTGMAVYNVTPLKVGKYFHKVQCFCFNEQTLQGGQDVSMPVMFYVDPALDKDPDMQDVDSITLSYTFYETNTKALDAALDAFYNDGNKTPSSTTQP